MQAAAVEKLTSKAPVDAGALASDAAATDGVDFAALLAAQFQGKDGVALPIVEVDAGVEVSLQVDRTAQDFMPDVVADAQARTVADPLFQIMAFMPAIAPVVQAMQQVSPEVKQVIAMLSPDESSGDRRVSALSSLADAGLVQAKDMTPVQAKYMPPVQAKDMTLVLAKEGAAEFTASGKLLPPSDSNASGESKLPALLVDAQQLPDAAPAVPAIMSTNQIRPAGEIKAPVGGVQPPVGASGWGDALGQKVVWMAGQHQQVAELHLNPPNLGPMEVRLTINNDQISAIFVSPHLAVRDAIEAAMPRLREMFADSGMMLGNAMVSSDSLPQRQNSGQEKQSGAESRSDFPLLDGYSMPVTASGVIPLHGDGRGLVDLFA